MSSSFKGEEPNGAGGWGVGGSMSTSSRGESLSSFDIVFASFRDIKQISEAADTGTKSFEEVTGKTEPGLQQPPTFNLSLWWIHIK